MYDSPINRPYQKRILYAAILVKTFRPAVIKVNGDAQKITMSGLIGLVLAIAVAAQAPHLPGMHASLKINKQTCFGRATRALRDASLQNISTKGGWTAHGNNNNLRAAISCVQVGGQTLVDIVVAGNYPYGVQAMAMRDRLWRSMQQTGQDDNGGNGRNGGDGNYDLFPASAVRGYNTKTLKNVSVQECMRACDKESWCKSFDYYKGTVQGQHCHLSNKNAEDVGGLITARGSDGYDNYQKRNALNIILPPDIPFVQLRLTYRLFPASALRGHNTKTLKNVSVQECMRACDKESWCKSFDYYKGTVQGQHCHLSNKNAEDVGGLVTARGSDGYDSYQKRNR